MMTYNGEVDGSEELTRVKEFLDSLYVIFKLSTPTISAY
jgi:hypothetical protein